MVDMRSSVLLLDVLFLNLIHICESELDYPVTVCHS